MQNPHYTHSSASQWLPSQNSGQNTHMLKQLCVTPFPGEPRKAPQSSRVTDFVFWLDKLGYLPLSPPQIRSNNIEEKMVVAAYSCWREACPVDTAWQWRKETPLSIMAHTRQKERWQHPKSLTLLEYLRALMCETTAQQGSKRWAGDLHLLAHHGSCPSYTLTHFLS